ncbi:SPOR domain-containing protein [Marinobacterium arenosum]|uniref:SPOR domain-containing protein n=1 Tax=Marinobacterium arenosum TaxID=2862496 RepID=UPI001C94A6F5|nr:SPOR domain-containing protein [Marinobacterium arenosum]MBY4676500.1 SPOR domain-containing protein [Marinobacterium arenosum]
MLLLRTLSLLLLLNLPALANEPESSESSTNEAELIIVELRFDQHRLTENLFLYRQDNRLLLPLETLANLLDFAITINEHQSGASGWFIDPERTFELDLPRQQVSIAGVDRHLPANSDIRAIDGDLYIPKGLLEQWFPIHLAFNFAEMRLFLRSDEPLPLQQRLQREKQHLGLHSGGRLAETPVRYLEDRYNWVSYPTLDVALNKSLSNKSDLDTFSASLSASGDLLKHSAFLNYNYNDQSHKENIRLNLSRYAATPESRLAGGLYSYQFGDLYTIGDSLISAGGDGVGLSLTSSATNQRTRYANTVIEGNAPANWEAELYRNGTLLAFQTISSDGFYSFEQVELWYGANNFEVRLFGPQGQARIERTSTYIGDSLLPSGESSYAFYTLDEKNNRLFGDLVPSTDRRSDSDLRAEWTYGVTDNWALGTAWNRLVRMNTNSTDTHDYLSLSSDLSLPNSYLQTVLSHDTDGGNALLLSLRSNLGAHNIDLQHRQFNNFTSEENPASDQLKTDTRLRLSGTLTTDAFINYTFTAQRESLVDAPNRYKLESRLSSQLSGINLTHTQSLSKRSDDANLALPGSLSASRYNSQGGLSGALNYDLGNNDEILQSISGGLHTNLDDRRHNLLRLTYEPGIDESWSIKDDFTWRWDGADLTLRAEANDQDDWLLGASITFSTGYDAYRRSPWISSRRSSRQGTVNARVFWDRDNSGTFSPGDQPLSGVRLNASGTYIDQHTDDNGRLQVRNIPTFKPMVLNIDESTLDDPFWQLREQPEQLYLHTSAQAELELPIIAVSEIEGRMFAGDERGQHPLKSTRMLLVDKQEKIVATTWSEFDGMFIFDNVPPGNYSVQADRDFLQQKGLSIPPAQPVTASLDGGVINVGTTILYGKSVIQAVPTVIASHRPLADQSAPKPIDLQWLQAQPSNHYTIQLMAGHKKRSLQRFIKRYQLTDTRYYHIRKDGHDWYVLLQGFFPDHQQALSAFSRLPQSLRKKNPWVRSLAGIQKLLHDGPGERVDEYPNSFPQHYRLTAESISERIRTTHSWLNEQSQVGYTIQLMASEDPADLERFIIRHQLQRQALVNKVWRNGSPWYLLLYGYHPTKQGIKQVLREFPPQLSRFQPWIRTTASLQTNQTGNKAASKY